jgi:hypothetical protein
MKKELKTNTNRGFLTTEDEGFLIEGKRLGREERKLPENTGFRKEYMKQSI